MNRPLALVCYICGRQFGTKSLGIHIKTCEKKWENQQNLKPPKQRRPCPRPPPGFHELLAKEKITRNDINNYNTKSFDTFVEEGLVECEYCGRRFNEKSLVPHQKACKKDPMIKKTFVNKGALGKHSEPQQAIKPATYAYNIKKEDCGQINGNLVPCRRCGRTFNVDRVDKHQRVCKGEKVGMNKAKQDMMINKKVETVPQKMKPNFGIGKKAKWKIQHEEFQAAIKAMREMKAIQEKGGNIRDLPPPPPSNYDHYIQCRHCGRKYAPDVAERHIPKCANIINKPGGIQPSRIQQKYIAGTGSAANKVSNSTSIPFKPNLLTPNKSNNSKLYGIQGNKSGLTNFNAGLNEQPKPSNNYSYGPTSNTFGSLGSSSKAPQSNIKPNLKLKNSYGNKW